MLDEFDRLVSEGRFEEAATGEREKVQECNATEGPETLGVARHLVRLAFVCEELSRYDEAELHYERALAIRERVLGPEHPDIVTNLLNLGRLLTKRGRPERATDLLRRSIAIHSQIGSPDDRLLLSATNDLIAAVAASAQRTGDYGAVTHAVTEACALCEHSLAGNEKALALTLHNIGEVCRQRRQLNDAQHFLERSFDIRERLFGPTDSSTLNTSGTLAAVYNDQGQYGLAEPLLERILDVAAEYRVDRGVRCMALNNLAFLRERQGRMDGALSLYHEALELCRQEHGPRHPYTLHMESCIAKLTGGQQLPAQATCPVRSLGIAGLAACATWMLTIIIFFGQSTEMWPAYVAAVPAACAGIVTFCWARGSRSQE